MGKFQGNAISIGTLALSLALPFSLHAETEAEAFSGRLVENKGMLAKRWSIPFNENAYYESFCESHLQIGIEGGGTNTRIRINSSPSDGPEAQMLYSRTTKEGSNLYQNPDGAIKAVKKLINEGIKSVANKNKWDSKKICYDLGLGMAGTEGENNLLFLSALKKDPRMKRAVLASDAEVAWLSVFHNEGVIIISGTGSIILGRNAAGSTYRHGGYAIPMSDRYSAAALALDYGTCIHNKVSLQDDKPVWPKGLPLAYFKKLLEKSGGAAEQFLLKLNALVKSNVSQLAAMAPEIIDHSWPMDYCEEKETNHIGRCTNQSMGRRFSDKDYCAAAALYASKYELLDAIKSFPPDFKHLPFAIHGTFGNTLWSNLEQSGVVDEMTKSRKVAAPIDPLAGSLKLLDRGSSSVFWDYLNCLLPKF